MKQESQGTPASPTPLLLQVERLSVTYQRGPRRAAAPVVDEVSFSVAAGQTLGIVGESGAGKTTLARALLRLIPAQSGQVFFDGRDLLRLPEPEMRAVRRQAQFLFQDPLGSLDPRWTAGASVAEGVAVHNLVPRRQRREYAEELLKRVGLDVDHYSKRPHELSGGQRQRVALARALAVRPRLLVADEPVSGLDASVRAQVLNLLKDLQQEAGLTYVIISHDLRVIDNLADQVAVLHQGRVVEHGPPEAVMRAPQHPYTQRLLAAVPPRVGAPRGGA